MSYKEIGGRTLLTGLSQCLVTLTERVASFRLQSGRQNLPASESIETLQLVFQVRGRKENV